MPQTLFADVTNSLKILRKELYPIVELTWDYRKDIDEIVENLSSPLLIMVMGEFSRGKSTFINALIGQPITKVDAKPTTAVITKLSYGATDKITVYMRDGSTKVFDSESFAELTAESGAESNKLHENIDYVERTLPIDILKSMSIIDSPGLNSIKAVHEEITKKFMDKSDTVIWLFDANDPGKQTEIDAMKRLNPRLAPLVLVNKMDAIDEDEGDSPEKVLAKIECDLDNNKLEYQKIIGISAKMAYQGKIKNNEKLIAESNIKEFYDAVDTMILPNREQYKRNSMLDGLAKFIFSVGNILNRRREQNNKRKNTDYSAYIETEENLSASLDELENIADIVLTALESTQSSRRKRLNPAEKTFYGVLHWLGLFVEKNNETSQQYLEEAAVRNDTIAQHILIDVYHYTNETEREEYWLKKVCSHVTTLDSNAGKTEYEKGKSCEEQQNYQEAVEWYQKASEKGYADANDKCQQISNFIQIKKEAEAGSLDAMYKMADIYNNGDGVPKDLDKVVEWCRKIDDMEHFRDGKSIEHYMLQAENGNISAMLKLSDLSEAPSEKFYWYKKAAEAGSDYGQYELASCYEKGFGCHKDISLAIKWYEKASEHGIYASWAREKLGWLKYSQGLEYEEKSDYRSALKCFADAAKVNHYSGWKKLINIYRQGQYGVTKDYDKAIEYCNKAIKAGQLSIKGLLLEIEKEKNKALSVSPKEMFKLGYDFEQQGNLAEAMKCYKKAANDGYAEAMFRLAKLYQDSHDSKNATKWLQKARDNGYNLVNEGSNKAKNNSTSEPSNGDAKQKLAELQNRVNKQQTAIPTPSTLSAEEMYRKGGSYEGQDNYAEAMRCYRQAAYDGSTDAMNAIGRLYYHGIGVSKNYTESMKWFHMAATKGNSDASYNVGWQFDNGFGVKKDYAEALKWYTKASEINSRSGIAWRAIGFLYYEGGYNITQDYAKAFKYFCNGVNCNDNVSMTQIGIMYFNGYGVNQDYIEAMKWYRKAADAGDAVAMNNIGWLYQNGYGINQDYAEAMKWYRKAADAGYAHAMGNVGWLYQYGYGVIKNYDEAIKWYQKAIDAGDESAKKYLKDLRNKIEEENKKQEQKTSSSNGCFITTAVCDSFNKPDNCYELTTFRNFRDNWLVKKPDGVTLINEYYRTAPTIVANINLQSNAREIYREIWNQYLLPCLRYIEAGDNNSCKKLYISMVNTLRNKFAPNQK